MTLRHMSHWVRHHTVKATLGLGLSAACAVISGCEVNSFFDPSRTGRFHSTPTTIPILDRIDVIEQKDTTWARTSPPQADDLLPNELSYKVSPGDMITIGIFELYRAGEWSQSTRRVDPGGYLRVQEIGDIRAAGLTPQQLEDEIARSLMERVMTHRPQVDVVVEQGGAFRYSIYGYIQNTGLFTLQNPDLHMIEALSLAGGVPISTERIYVIRQVALSDELKPSFERRDTLPTPTAPGARPQPGASRPAANIEDLIQQLEKDRQSTPPSSPSSSMSPPAPAPAQPVPSPTRGLPEPATKPLEPAESQPQISPGMMQQPNQPPVDIDELEPVRVGRTPPPVDVDTLNKTPQASQPDDEDSFIYVPERGEWVRVKRGMEVLRQNQSGGAQATTAPAEPQLVVERVIEIDYKRLAHGDSTQNVIVRPGDRIYIDGPPTGFIYVDGEIFRPGVYSMPQEGILTLSRLVAAAGGMTGLAIPTRVDLTRKVSRYREATIRLDLAAIRQRTEPDVVLKPDDTIIIGTSWIATPLAVLRNGFRATYGFGIVLDRNFGPDVFGPEPTDNNSFF
jgi:protein involved in polysaccharide export with SLBB domain